MEENTMKELQRGLFEFWGQFGIPVFVDGYADTETPLPYITFDVETTEFADETILRARVWTRDDSFDFVTDTLDKIAKVIPSEGVVINIKGGAVVLYRSNPFIQYFPTDEKDLKVGYVSVIAKQYKK
jgi:hypothetical protein